MKPFYVSLKPFIDHQTLVHPTQWPDIFGNDKPIDVEIGFGNGEYLAKLASNDIGINYVGFEEYCERISKTLRKLSRVPGDNVRVMRLDVRPGFKYLFAPQTIRQMFCLFPPPWPKKGDIKHRLFTPDFLKLANNRLQQAGTLKIVTDAFAFADWIEEQIPNCGFEYTRKRIAAVHDTKFERKWVQEGQGEFAEILLTKKEHKDIPPNQEVVLEHYKINGFNPESFQMADYSDGNIAVAFKDMLYDPKRQIALVYVLVHDEHLLQNVRIVIAQEGLFWRVYLAQGSLLMPTSGIAKAIECVRDAAIDSLPPVGRVREGGA